MLDFQASWYRSTLSFQSKLLLPFSWLFGFIATIRRCCYQVGILKTYDFDIPLWVVGNITVGGAGKTPFVIALVQYLQANGFKPGVVSRGYKATHNAYPCLVDLGATPDKVGDEPLLIARRTQVPVVICKNRVKAVDYLMRHTDCNVIISDDGLQHYRLKPAYTIAVVDTDRGFGNKQLLPAGPLREPINRLQAMNMIVHHQATPCDDHCAMTLSPHVFISMHSASEISFDWFKRQKIHAVAGIGHPQRFFNMLRQAGFDVIEHAFPDHYIFTKKDLDFLDDYPVIMTEKDAIKCELFSNERCWFVRVEAILNAPTLTELSEQLRRVKNVN